MTFSGIALDKWAAGSYVVDLTILIIVSICLLISIALFSMRLFQVYQENQTQKTTRKEKLLQICHLSAMFFSCVYIFLYEWNYIHMYIHNYGRNCDLWFILIMISITMTKVSLYSFLMLRSALAFRNSFFRIPLRLALSVTIISVSAQLTMMALMLSDFTTFKPIPNRSLCFRTLGANGTIGIGGFNICDAASAVCALFIFWTKAKSVNSVLFSNSARISDIPLNRVFNKHIRLGMLIAVGSILIFLAGEFLTIMMGVASTLHQFLNNFYIFLLFKSNDKCYVLCCTCSKMDSDATDGLQLHLHEFDVNVKKPEQECEDKHADGPSEGHNTFKMTSDIIDPCVATELQCTSSILHPTFLSKSLSSLPRFSSMKKDKRSLSSNCLQPPKTLQLANVPTITATSATDQKSGLHMKHPVTRSSFTPYSAMALISPHLSQPTPCRDSGSINFKISEPNHCAGTTLEIVYAE